MKKRAGKVILSLPRGRWYFSHRAAGKTKTELKAPALGESGGWVDIFPFALHARLNTLFSS